MIWLLPSVFLVGVFVGVLSRLAKIWLSANHVQLFSNTRVNPTSEVVTRQVTFVPQRNSYLMFVWVDGDLSNYYYESPDSQTWTQKRFQGLLSEAKAA